MNLTPESEDALRRSIAEKHRLTRRARLEALQTDVSHLRALAAEFTRHAALVGAQIDAMKREIDQQDDTTIRLPTLPERR